MSDHVERHDTRQEGPTWRAKRQRNHVLLCFDNPQARSDKPPKTGGAITADEVACLPRAYEQFTRKSRTFFTAHGGFVTIMAYAVGAHVSRPITHLPHIPSRQKVGARRFELPTSCSRSRRATRLRYAPINSTHESFVLWTKFARDAMRKCVSAER